MKKVTRSLKMMVILLSVSLIGLAQPGKLQIPPKPEAPKAPGFKPEKPMDPVGANYQLIKDHLTKEQKDMLDEQRKTNQEMRKAFRATLTDEQKEILQDPELMGREKREAFRATLSDDQIGLMESHRAARQAQREAFKATLTDEQKALIKKAMQERRQHMHNMMNRKHNPDKQDHNLEDDN